MSLNNKNDKNKTLRELVRKKKKQSNKKPKVFLNFQRINTTNDKNEERIPELFVHDIQKALLYSLLGSNFKVYPRWCTVLRANYIRSVVLITVNNLSENDYIAMKKDISMFENIFDPSGKSLNSVNFLSSYVNYADFYNEFTNISFSAFLKQDAKKEFSSTLHGNLDDVSSTDRISRLSLLLNAEQMIKEDFPLPHLKSKSTVEYVFTKPRYRPVNETSPIFGIDCEMCYNIYGDLEVIWLAVVNENLESVYVTYIKPLERVEDYLTQITGVTAHTLKDVHTTVYDVRNIISKILPEDAILVGHSLSNDLHGLKLYHPYVIDTSIIYNLSGTRETKSSLKNLAKQFLGKTIQLDTHNPVIDAQTAIELVKLKLSNNIEFGDIIVNGIATIVTGNVTEYGNNDIQHTQSINLFNILKNYSIKSMLIDREDRRKYVPDNCEFVSAQNNLLALISLKNYVNTMKFAWCQLYIENSENKKTTKLSNEINQIVEIYEALSENTFFVVIFTGNESTNTAENMNSYLNSRKGKLFLTTKSEESKILDDEITKLLNEMQQ